MRNTLIDIVIVSIGFIFASLIWKFLEVYSLIVCAVLVVLIVFITLKSNNKETIYFTKLKPDAKIPTKRDEDMGYDIYPCFSEEFMTIMPHETKMIPTGIGSAFNQCWGIILKERGSTGSKGIAQRCGVIDSGYRGEWLVPVTNTTDKELIISKEASKADENSDVILYPYNKAICQAIILPSPSVRIKEVTNDEFSKFNSKRGVGKLGSSGK